MTANRLRPTAARSTAAERGTRNSAFPLPSYPAEWLLNRAAFRRVIQQFNRDITEFRATFEGIRSQSPPGLGTGISFSDHLRSRSTPSNSPPLGSYQTPPGEIAAPRPIRRFRSQSPVSAHQRPILPSTTSGHTPLFESPASTFSVPRASSVPVDSIEHVGDLPPEQQSDAASHRSSEQAGTRQPTSHSTNPTSTSTAAMADNNDWQNSGFSQQQWAALQNLIRGVAAVPGPAGPQGPIGPQGTPAPSTSNGNGNGKGWNAVEVGFFDPMYDGKSAATGGPIEHTGKDTYFRDVNVFIERVKDMAEVKGAELVRQNLYTCFKGTALAWYTTVPTEDQKRLVKLGTGVDEWARVLHKRFKESASSAMATITRERYTMEDARRKREPMEYAHVITRAAKAAEITTHAQIFLLYNGLELEFRRDLAKLTDSTTIEAFLQDMEDNKEIWWDLGARNSRGHAAASYSANRSGNSFRPSGQSGSYNNSSFANRSGSSGGSLPQGSGYGYSTGYPAAGNQSQPRQTQFPSSYQFNNSYQNRAYPNQYNQQNRSQSKPPPPAGGGQPFGRGQPPPQDQAYRPAGSMPANTFQPRNASGFQPRPPQQQPQNRPPGGGYPSNQYQNRPAFGQRSNPPAPAMQQRAYQTEGGDYPDDQDQSGEAFQGDHDGNDDAFGYLPPDDEAPEEAFHQSDEAYHGRQTQDEASSNHDDGEVRTFFTEAPEPKFSCRRCEEKFTSNNKLHYHVRRCKKPTIVKPKLEAFRSRAEAKIIHSSAPHDSTPGLGFKSWRYAKVMANIDPLHPEVTIPVCTDSGCGSSIIDRQCLASQRPDYASHVLRKPEPLKIKGIGSSTLSTDEYIPLDFAIPGEADGKPATACFTRHLYIVDDLKANILLGNDILGPEDAAVHVGQQKLTIGSCGNFSAPLEVVARDDGGERIKRTIRSEANVTIPAHSCSTVPIKYRGSRLPDRDMLFNPNDIEKLGQEGGVFSHIVDANFSVVQIRNTTSKPVSIARNEQLGTLTDYEEDGCYLASPEIRHLAAGSWTKRVLKIGVAALAAFQGITSTTSPGSKPATPTTAVPEIRQEHVTSSGITVYGTDAAAQAITSVAEAFPSLWQDDGSTVCLPPEEWMPITLEPDAKVAPSKVYPVGQTDKDFIDQEFDKLQSQGKLEFTSQPTPFSFPVFVVWRTIQKPDEPPVRKGRVVVDIRGLNKVTKLDTYPMPLQADITALVAGCPYISVFDAASFFY